MSRVVLAPSAAGKTHFIEKLGVGDDHPLLIDGDRIPEVAAAYRKLYDEFGSEWWLHPDHQLRKAALFHEVRVSALGRYDKDIILTAEKGLVTPEAQVVVVLPQWKDMQANMVSRIKSGNKSQPQKWSVLQGSYESVSRYAQTRNLPVRDTFEGAMEWFANNVRRTHV